MSGLAADCLHALRVYRRSPVASAIAIAVLSLGMAFAGAFLSLYVDLILRPDPGFQDSREIMTMAQSSGGRLSGLPYAIVERMSDEMASIEAAATLAPIMAIVESRPVPVATAMVSSEFFPGLRPHLALGRGFTDEDHALEAEPVAVLSYRYWQQEFGSDTSVIGTVLEIATNSGMPFQNSDSGGERERDPGRFRIVGVVAKTLPRVGRVEPGIWLPLERAWSVLGPSADVSLETVSGLGTYVRRAPGVSTAAVANELRASFDLDAYWFPGTQLDAIDGIVGNFAVQREARRQLELFLAGSLLLVIVAGANISLFLLARAPGRRRELGIRMAVGAPLGRLARQLATEAGLLVALGGLLGLLGSIWLGTALRNLDMLRDAEWSRVTLFDWRGLSLFGLALLLVGVLVSLAPIMGLKRLGIAESSRQVSARASVAQRCAGLAQLGMAAAIGAAAIAFGWHLTLLMFGDAGYKTSDRYVIEEANNVGYGFGSYMVTLANRREALLSIPGVTAVAFGFPVPAYPGTILQTTRIEHPTEPENPVHAYRGAVSRPLVELLGLTLLYGRAPEEDETGRVVVVNQALARALWGRDDVVGEQLPAEAGSDVTGAEVIGVLKDLSFEHPSATVPPYLYLVLSSVIGEQSLPIIEAQLTASELQQELDRLVSAGALEMQVAGVSSLKSLRNDTLANDRVRAFLTMVTAAVVIFLAAIGLYGIQHYLVAIGRREHAIRAALGAGPRSLGGLVLGRSVVLGLPGLALGALLAFIVVTWLKGDYVAGEVSPVAISLGVVIGLALLNVAVSVGPARQACRVQVAPLLRED